MVLPRSKRAYRSVLGNLGLVWEHRIDQVSHPLMRAQPHLQVGPIGTYTYFRSPNCYAISSGIAFTQVSNRKQVITAPLKPEDKVAWSVTKRAITRIGGRALSSVEDILPLLACFYFSGILFFLKSF